MRSRVKPARPFGTERGDASRLRLVGSTDDSAGALLEQARVGHLVGQSVLEGVLQIREEARLVDHLCGLEPGQSTMELVLRRGADRPQEFEGDVLADDCGGLQKLLLGAREAIDARGQDGLYGRRDPDGVDVLERGPESRR